MQQFLKVRPYFAKYFTNLRPYLFSQVLGCVVENVVEIGAVSALAFGRGLR